MTEYIDENLIAFVRDHPLTDDEKTDAVIWWMAKLIQANIVFYNERDKRFYKLSDNPS